MATSSSSSFTSAAMSDAAVAVSAASARSRRPTATRSGGRSRRPWRVRSREGGRSGRVSRRRSFIHLTRQRGGEDTTPRARTIQTPRPSAPPAGPRPRFRPRASRPATTARTAGPAPSRGAPVDLNVHQIILFEKESGEKKPWTGRRACPPRGTGFVQLTGAEGDLCHAHVLLPPPERALAHSRARERRSAPPREASSSLDTRPRRAARVASSSIPEPRAPSRGLERFIRARRTTTVIIVRPGA